jgi:hypothetical protein
MNGTVGRNRADAMNRNLGTMQRPDANKLKSGSLQGRSISFSPMPNPQRKLSLTLTGFDKIPELAINGLKISLSEEKPVPMSNRRENIQEASRMMRQYSSMMRTINNDPQLKEVQAHINNGQTLVTEMMGMDPATPEELEHMMKSLTDLSDALDRAAETLDSRERDLSQDVVKNPVPVQQNAIQYLKDLINERLGELTDFVLPDGESIPEPKSEVKTDSKPDPQPKPEVKPNDGPPTKEVLESLPEKLKGTEQLVNNPVNGKTSKDILNAINFAMSVVKTGLNHLDRAPGNRVEMGKMAADLGNVLELLENLSEEISTGMKDNPDFKDVAGDVKNLLDSARQEIGQRKNALVTATGLNPLSTKAIFHSKSFSTQGAQNLLKEKLDQAKQTLADLKLANAPKGKLEMAEESVKVLTRAVAFLEDRLDQLRTGNSDETISEKKAIELMGSEGADKGIKDDSAAEYLRGVLHDKIDLSGDGPMERLKKSGKYLREDGIMETFVDFALRQAGMDVPEDLRTELQNRRYDALNSQAWKPISKEVVLRHNGESHAMRSDVIPQSNLGEHFSDMKGGGVVCHAARHFEHGTTVAVSRLTAPDGTKLFEGVRHGILNCYGISSQTLHELNPKELEKLVENLLDKSKWKLDHNKTKSLALTIDAIKTSKSFRRECSKLMQAAGSERRAMDLVATNLLKNDAKLQFALDQVGKPNPKPVEINLNSIALVTPDYMRAAKGQSGPGNERKMLQGQMKALAKISGDPQPRELEIKGANGEVKTVLVHVKVNAFNFGVNAGAFGLKGKRILKFPFAAAWGTSDKYNKKAMDTLIGPKSLRGQAGIGGQVKDWLDANPGAPVKTKTIVLKLAQQVAKLWDDKGHRNAGNEPYKMVSRLALLTSMIGGDTCWNCKSGKDRTGMMDVDTKRLAAEIWMSGTVPEPDEKPSSEIKSNRFRMAMDGGNLEIQNYNTGAPGFKLGGVPSLEKQMRLHKDDERYEYFRGIAGFYGT